MSFNSREEEGASCSADVHKSSKFDSVDSSQEWRSWDQLEASPPSTSPPWDSDDDDESGPSVSGPRPSDLYGKFTWKIEKFSQINKRELRSNVFEVGGYKWYILVYPQGCDVCNHLSLFLCVADYDKLLPGWSHFAQFTIAVVNKDPKKSKYSDTLHRFCKKEHDWGWKKFMELSKVLDGFTVADTLVIKAQVQVIRENPHRPFRCLDCQYRRELVRVYLTNVEGICRRFVEEKREKIGKLMEDTVRWSSFRAFWSAVEENVRRRLSREKVDTILKAVVKFFFNEKEVTSTLVMDALYSGCKALDYRSKNKKGKINGVEVEETVNPVVWVDKDAFVLAGDVLLLLERAANEFLPPYKDDKGPQNRTKDGGPGDDFGKDSVERDERRLTELGRRTVEMFVLAHLFSSHVEVAYQEAIALKRQEELIREEEAAGQAEIEIKAKREAAEKEKRTKKKQAKQRRSNRKEKEKEVEEKRLVALQQEPRQREDSTCGRPTSSCLLKETSITSVDIGDEDDDLSVLDTNDDIVGTLGPAVEDGDADRALCEREVSEMHQMMEASFSGGSCVDSAQNKRSNWKHQLHVDDSSSACSSDSIPSINAASNGSTRRRSIVQDQNHNLHRRRDRVDNEACDKDSRLAERDGMLRGRLGSAGTGEASSSCNSGGLDAETIIESLKKRIQWLQQRLLEKEEEVVMLHEKLSLYQHHFGSDIGILDKQFFEPGDSYQKAEAPDPRPPSPLSRKKGEVPENQGKCVDEPQDLDRVAVKDATLTNGSAVSSNVINGASQSSNFVDVNSGGHINHNQSMADVQTLPATSHSHGYGLSLSEVSALNTPIAFVPVNFLSENSVPPSTSHSGLSTGSTTEMELSRPSSAPGLVAPSGSFPSPPLPHPPSSLVRSISTTERLGIGSLELATSNCPARQQSPPITHRNAAAGVIRNNNPTVHTGPFVSTVSAAGIRTHGSAGGYPYLSSGYSHHPISAPSGLGDVSPSASSIHTRKMSAVVCRQGVPGATNSVKDETTMAVGTNFLGTEDQVEGMYIVDAMENVLTQRAERGQHSMGFTFGTVTPEMLHLQHQQDQQRECVNASLPHTELDVPKEDFYQDLQFRHQSGERHNGKEPQKSIQNHGHLHGAQKYNFMLHHGLSQNVSGQRGGTRQNVQSVADSTTSGATMSEEFPHLDIINDLLDDDKIFGAKALNAFLQQSGNQGYHQHLSLHDLHDLHRICSAQVHPEFISVHGNGSERSDRGIPCEDGSHAIPGSSERAHNSLRESLQFRPYTHPPLSRSFSPHGGSVDGISGHHWPGSLGDLPVTSGANGVRSGVDVFVGYPMQNSHISIPDCPPFTLGQNGYTMYSPIKHP